MRATLLLLTAAATAAACQSEDSADVAQDRIWTEYQLVYDKASDRTMARAVFRFGHALGTALELTGAAGVTFEGQPLTFNRTLAVHERTLAGPVPGGTFRYVDHDANTFENALPTPRPIDLPPELREIPMTGAYTLRWAGEPLARGESMDGFLSGPERVNARRFAQDGTGATDVVIGADLINQLAAGPAIITVRRFATGTPARVTGAGGRTVTEYKSAERRIELRR